MLPWLGVRTWLEKSDLRLDQGEVKGQVQWLARGLRRSGLQLGVSVTMGSRPVEESTLGSHHSDVCTGCPESRKLWSLRRNKKGPGWKGEFQPWRGAVL